MNLKRQVFCFTPDPFCMTQASWVLMEGDGPIVAVALHDGMMCESVAAAITEIDRWREEDPFTATWTAVGIPKLSCGDRDLSLI